MTGCQIFNNGINILICMFDVDVRFWTVDVYLCVLTWTLSSWTDSKSLRLLVRCVTFFGRIRWRISVAKKPQSTLLTTASEVAHISTGTLLNNDRM